MQKSSLVNLLRTFRNEELTDFENFISSSYLNRNSIAVILFKKIKKYAPDFTDKGLEKEILWEKIYPGKKYNYGILKNLIFDLKKLAEDYLSFTHWKNNSIYDKSLISELWERNAMDIFLKKANLFNAEVDKTKIKDQQYYAEKFFVQAYIDDYYLNRIMHNEQKTRTNELIVESFMMNYLLNCFQLAIEMHKTNKKHDLRFLEYLLNYFKEDKNSFKDSPLLRTLFFLMLSFFDIEDDTYYRRAREIFLTIVDSLPVNESKNVYNILMVLCLFKINAGKHEYRKIQLELNFEVFNRRILSHRKDGSIELEAYRNIVKLAVNTNEYSMMKDFINANKHKVISSNPAIVVMYSDATLRFCEKKFEECLNICSKIKINDFWEQNSTNFFFKGDIKMLQLKSHYDLDHLETALSAVDSFKHFLNNTTEVNEQNKSYVRQFLNILGRLIPANMNSDKKMLKKLHEEVSAVEIISSKPWLLEKINKLL